MVDSLKKCQNYETARSNVNGFYKIELAPNDSKVWRQKRSTIGGYIGKNGFNAHT